MPRLQEPTERHGHAKLEEPPGAARELAALSAVPLGSWIAGELVRESAGEPIAVEDPATGEVLCAVPNADEAIAVRALDAASAAQPLWAATPASERRDLLRLAYDAVMAHEQELALLLTLEMGKPLAEARAEVRYAAEFLRWFSEEATRIAGRYSDHADGTGRVITRKHPVGPCLLITPWNFPLAMATRKIGPALAAGCTVIVKPAKQTPLSTLRLTQLFSDCGLPRGVLNVITTERAGAVTATMLADGRIRKLSFTGSTAVGRHLLAACADGVIRCSTELGGNAPLIVFDDADLAQAVDGALLAKVRNGGESCTAANRIYVQAGIAEAFAEALTERMAALRVGRGTEGVDVGPLIDAAARERVAALVDDAVRNGARVLTGGGEMAGPGHFFEPTVLTDLGPDAQMLKQEIFGPVAPILTFAGEDDAVLAANKTEYGLVAYVFTCDLDRALRVSDRLDTGMVGINQGIVANAAAPFGGVKQSGVGKEGGPEGIDAYLTTKYIALAGAPAAPSMVLERHATVSGRPTGVRGPSRPAPRDATDRGSQ
jgi:succinate-semialdehyde dehydrogenase / glutarate-semialdehyde dehydrogenase